ncbi:BTB/POZ domain-containing protein [Ditylenchus destructor]|nr:BTB/POZ domain-containing protein [Ditylenchus destructor]
MTGNNSAPNNDWVRLNVGGKVFQTTKDTLSRYPESFLAGLVNSGVPSEKDETGAFLIDRDPEHFRIVLNYLRNGVLHMERNEIAKELLCEADFYGLHALVDEINRSVPEPMRTVTKRTEMVIVSRNSSGVYFGQEYVSTIGYLQMSENHEDYEVLQVLRQKIEIKTHASNGRHYITLSDANTATFRTVDDTLMDIELILRNFGFVQEFNDNMYGEVRPEGYKDEITSTQSMKFIRTVR